MDELQISLRADIPDADKWDLTHLSTNAGKWQEDLAWLQRTYPKLQSWKRRIGESAQTLADVLEFEKSLELNHLRSMRTA
jgi:oligoendopeptidase F